MEPPGETTSVNDHSKQLLGCNYDGDILSCFQLHIFEACNYAVLAPSIAICGVVANVINIIVFFRQGFSNTVNVSFFGLAISDLCCLVTLMWACVCLNPFIVTEDMSFDPGDLAYLPGAWPHVTFGRITSYITVFITAERCLSIITPLKVKQIITPRRTTVAICLIYIINILALSPEYAGSYLAFRFIPERNATLLSAVYTSHRPAVMGLVYILNSITGITSFVSVIVWTSLLVIKLQQSSKWRKKAGNDRDGVISSREKKTVKMVAIIATVLIVCYIPGSVVAMATFVEKELAVGGRYINVSVAMWSIAFVFHSVNSSVNIILYYKMSSNYRRTFNKVFNISQKVVD